MRSKVVGPHEGETLTVVGDVMTFKLTAADTAERFVLGEGLVAPGGGPPPHLHEREDELFYVLEGRMEFCLDSTRGILGPGDAAWAPRNVVHAFKNVGDVPMRAIVVAMPTNFESFYRECGEPFRLGNELPRVSPESIQKLLATAPKYGLQVHPGHAFPDAAPPAPPARMYWALGNHVTVALASEQTGGHFTLSVLSTPPGEGAPPHAHRAEDEVFYVLDGRFEFLLGDRTETLGRGTTVFVPRGTMHYFRNVGQADARLISMHTPGGFERFFADVGEPCADRSAPPPPPPDPARVMPLLDKHGMDVPPMS
jgi:mannose-6-phosphate isomerase-like protein (cupin superfamily)